MADKTLEKRAVEATFELRAAESTAPVLEGYAATFNQPYDMGAFREQIDPGAFARTLGTKPDVRLLIDHAGQPLARTKSGTLDLSSDSQGLHMRSTLDPNDPDVQRLLPKMRRGDLDQMSFAFRIPAGGDEWGDNFSLRTLRNIELNGGDVSVVTYPANPGTSVSVRAEDLREARWTRAEAIQRELRAGNDSADLMAELLAVLAQIAAADNYIDASLASMSAALGVPNPDVDDDEADEPVADDEGAEASGMPLGLAQAMASALAL